jgi:hypothetical protein
MKPQHQEASFRTDERELAAQRLLSKFWFGFFVGRYQFLKT